MRKIILRLRVKSRRRASTIETVAELLQPSTFVKRRGKWMASDVIDGFLRAEDFGREAKIIVRRIERHSGETGQDD